VDEAVVEAYDYVTGRVKRVSLLTNKLQEIEKGRKCKLPELPIASLEGRARRLLECEDPPVGVERRVCEKLVRGDEVGALIAIWPIQPTSNV
jgi:hypothetical protein